MQNAHRKRKEKQFDFLFSLLLSFCALFLIDQSGDYIRATLSYFFIREIIRSKEGFVFVFFSCIVFT